MKYKLTITLSMFIAFFTNYTSAQSFSNHVTWHSELEIISTYEAEISMVATIEDGWHIYALHNRVDSPIQMDFNFEPNKSYQLLGEVIQPDPKVKFEKLLGFNVSYFDTKVKFTQRIKRTGKDGSISGLIEFMACSDTQCLPPQTIDFALIVN